MEFWYKRSFIAWCLYPLSLLFRVVVFCRKKAYDLGILTSTALPVPVIVVGNITVGGAGKTPTVLGLINLLLEDGYRPGIISRGYGGQNPNNTLMVSSQSTADEVGDEALLLFHRTQVPMVVGANRVEAAKKLLENSRCNIIISDDGLQHYALKRDIEIAVMDAERLCGNGFLLPAGPLREPKCRLKTVDMVLYNGESQEPYQLTLQPGELINLHNPQETKCLKDFAGKTVRAVAGIGYPKRFFNLLKSHNITLMEMPFSDHYAYKSEDLVFQDAFPLIMTEKDSVKCQGFHLMNAWYLPVDSHFNETFKNDVKRAVKNFSQSKNSV